MVGLNRLWHWWLGLSGSARATIVLEVIGILVVAAYTTIAGLQWKQSADNFVASQRPYVSMGKRDGAIGEFIDSSAPKGDAGIMLYFHNGGNLPASRFNVQLSAVSGNTVEEHMGRLKGKRTGVIAYLNGLKTIARDSDDKEFFPNWVPQSDVTAVKAGTKPLSLTGMFEYCDEFGEYVCRHFMLRYDPKPIDGFNLIGTTECGSYKYPSQYPKIPEDMEYMLPCEQPDEQKKKQKEAMRYMEWFRPSPIPAWHTPTATATP
jgi:hypothetical protein